MVSTTNTNPLILTVVNPATLEVLGQTQVASEQEVKGKIEIARRTFGTWCKMSLAQRLERLERFRKLLVANRMEVAQLISKESGKPLVESLCAEVFSVLETCNWLKKNAAKILAPESVSINRLFFTFKKSYNVFDPLGVIGVISPWNFPFAIPASSVLTALVAGNTVVLKPSPKTPLSAQLLRDLLLEAGFPAGAALVVQGDRDQARWLVEGDIDRVVFTGSVNGGKAIMDMAAKRLLPLTLELGGKHPAIVLADANVDKVADAIVWNAFTNAGQACASIERLYVHHTLHDALVAKVVERTNQLRMGDPLHVDTDIGPMIDAAQLDRVNALVQRAVAAGARVAAGGRVRGNLAGRLPAGLSGHYMEPTVLTGLWHGHEIVREEIFGPVLPIVPFHSVEEAVALANNCKLALGASIYTGDKAAGERLARRIRAGMVWVNDGIYSHACPDAPWGGLHNSGFGRTHGKHALLDFVNIKHIGSEGQGKRDWHFPYNTDRLELIDKGLTAVHGQDWSGKAKALLGMLPRVLRLRFGKGSGKKSDKKNG